MNLPDNKKLQFINEYLLNTSVRLHNEKIELENAGKRYGYAINEYKKQGGMLDSLQQYKNFVQSYHITKVVIREDFQ